MISRRLFGGCALCTVLGTMGLSASEARAQQAPAGIRRAVVARHDLAGTNHETIQMTLDLDPNIEVASHTHPGIEATYMVDGELQLVVRGETTRTLKPGDSFMVPAGTVHAAKSVRASRLFITYVVEKGKPLASPA